MDDRAILEGVGDRKAARLITMVPLHRCHAPHWCTHRMDIPSNGKLETTENHFRGEDEYHGHIHFHVCVCVVCVWRLGLRWTPRCYLCGFS